MVCKQPEKFNTQVCWYLGEGQAFSVKCDVELTTCLPAVQIWRQPTPFLTIWVSAAKSGGMLLVSLSLETLWRPASHQQYVHVQDCLHKHIFARLMSAGRRCRCYTKGGQDWSLWDAVFEVFQPSACSASGGEGEITVCNKLHDHFDHVPIW